MSTGAPPAAHWRVARRLPALVAAALLGSGLYLPGLATIPFADKGEPREALFLQTQMRTGEWILPRLGGTTLPSKPPLTRWLGGAVATVTGRVDERAARLPSALLATAAMALVAVAAAARFGALAGVFTAVVLASTWTWVGAARMARTDMPLAACLTAALLALERVARAPAPSAAMLCALYASAALAVLAKGPVGIAIPALVGLTYLALRRDLAHVRRMRLVAGVLLVLGMAGSWYALAAWQGGEAFLARQLGHENVARFLGGAERTSHAKPFYYYGPMFLVGFLPWTPLLLPTAVLLWSRRGRLDQDGLLFPLVWCLGVIGFYSLAAGKRTIYILPAYPAAAMLVGALAAPALPGSAAVARTAPFLRAAVWVLLAVVVAGGVAVLWLGVDPVVVLRALHPRDQHAVAELLVAARTHRGVATACVTAVGALLFATAHALGTGAPRSVLAVFGALAILGAVALGLIVQPHAAGVRTLRGFARAVAARLPADGELRFVGPPNGGVVFYLDRDVPSARRPVWKANVPGHCRHLFVWKRRWRQMKPETRAQLVVLAKSAGRGPEGDDRLLLARARSCEQSSP